MHKPESVLQNETHKILRDLKIQTAHLILARRPDLVMIKKKKKKRRKKEEKKRTCGKVDFTAPVNHTLKIKQRKER